jgi:hypothetical protein
VEEYNLIKHTFLVGFYLTHGDVTTGPGYLQDILQNSRPDLKLEKAFNNYWSQAVPFCSLCTAFSKGKVS